MPAERKLTDEDVARLRALAADGWSHQELAAEFGVSRQHAGRLVRGDQRPDIADAEADGADGVVSASVDAFLADLELSAADAVLAATARTLAAKLDGCAASQSATAAQAAPRLAAALLDVLERLRACVPREADAIDLLRERRRARLAVLADAARTEA